jgi:hypothetical protein
MRPSTSPTRAAVSAPIVPSRSSVFQTGNDSGVDAAEHLADAGRGVRADRPVAQQRLPDRERLGRQPGHRERAGLAVLGQQRRHRLRDDRAGGAHPLGLVAVALDRRAPVGGHLELRQRALDAQRPALGVDPVDVRRHPARERRELGLFVSAHYGHALQRRTEDGEGLGIARGVGHGDPIVSCVNVLQKWQLAGDIDAAA